jgi:hypothetical protein
MRDPARIDDILAALRAAWIEAPDLRLGQLIVNVVRPKTPCPDVFHAGDDVLLRGLHDLLDQMQRARPGNGAALGAVTVPEQVPILAWEVASTFHVTSAQLRERLGEPLYVETDSTRTFGGDEAWWVFRHRDGTFVGVSLRVPYEHMVVCTSQLSTAALRDASALLEPLVLGLYETPQARR